MKSYGHERIYFYYQEIPNVDSNYTCLEVIIWILFMRNKKT